LKRHIKTWPGFLVVEVSWIMAEGAAAADSQSAKENKRTFKKGLSKELPILERLQAKANFKVKKKCGDGEG
jgi:hypothetical protein